jgi:arylsulfatase
LRTDPYEFADITSNTYGDFWIQNGIIALASQAIVAKFIETFKDFPPVQKPNTFTVDDVLEKISAVGGGS